MDKDIDTIPDYFHQQSERLLFRKLTRQDIDVWTTFFVNNHSLKYLGIDLDKTPKEQASNWIEKQLLRYQNSGFGHLAVELKTTREFIGVGGILPREIEGQKEYEIAYSLIPTFWKKGYVTEIAQQLKKIGFQYLDCKQLISIIAKENAPSINVALKNGMKVHSEMTFLGMNVSIYRIDKKDA